MSVGHQVFLVLCIAYTIGVKSMVLGLWVLGPYALDTTSRATTKKECPSFAIHIAN